MRKPFKDTTGGFLGLRNVGKFRTNPFDFLLGLVREQGDIAFFKFGPLYDIYLVTNPDYIREILVKHWDKTVKWERMAHIAYTVATYNLAFLEGDDWKKHRKLLTPAFHTGRIKAYLELMCNHVSRMVDDWEDGQVYDMGRMMTQVTMGIIGEILFDIPDIERDAAKLSQALDVLIAQFVIDAGSLVVLPKWLPTERHKRERAAKATLISYLDERIQQRRVQGVDHGDVLSALLFTKDAETGESLTNEQVRDELYALFVAGHETTALLMTWTLYLLAQYPAVQAQLYEEVVGVMGDDDTLTLENLESLPFTDRVLKETLRMYPPAWSLLLREAVADIHLDEYVIPKGSVVYVSPSVQHHLPQYWDNPDTFDPSRFEGDWKATLPTYAYMPFGGGPRVCLGSHMADMEAKVILPTIIKHFSIDLIEPNQEVLKDGGFTLRPASHLSLRVRKRT